MKQLTCEMCGGTDLMKQDGIFVCQSCGMKYSAEDAKKLIIEGTVKIDNSKKLDDLYKLARQAKASNDSENAANYYGMIKQEDPDSWEAAFYNVYYRAMQTKIAFIASAANSITNSFGVVFALIKKEPSADARKFAVTDILLHVTSICSLFESNARSTLKSSWDNMFGTSSNSGDICIKYFQEYHSRSEAVFNMLFTLAAIIERDYSNNKDMMGLAVMAWKAGLQYWVNDYLMFDDAAYNKNLAETKYAAKVRQYSDPSYTIPAPNTMGFPLHVANRCARSTSPASSQGEGCYVATAVYGSYDCPQVWTLRRYRDYTLAETWHGRAFIKTYYAISPTLVKWFGHTEWFKKMWQGKLDRMVANLQANGVESTPYEDKNW